MIKKKYEKVELRFLCWTEDLICGSTESTSWNATWDSSWESRWSNVTGGEQ